MFEKPKQPANTAGEAWRDINNEVEVSKEAFDDAKERASIIIAEVESRQEGRQEVIQELKRMADKHQDTDFGTHLNVIAEQLDALDKQTGGAELYEPGEAVSQLSDRFLKLPPALHN